MESFTTATPVYSSPQPAGRARYSSTMPSTECFLTGNRSWRDPLRSSRMLQTLHCWISMSRLSTASRTRSSAVARGIINSSAVAISLYGPSRNAPRWGRQWGRELYQPRTRAGIFTQVVDAAMPFFKPCEGLAYTFPNDQRADSNGECQMGAHPMRGAAQRQGLTGGKQSWCVF